MVKILWIHIRTTYPEGRPHPGGYCAGTFCLVGVTAFRLAFFTAGGGGGGKVYIVPAAAMKEGVLIAIEPKSC